MVEPIIVVLGPWCGGTSAVAGVLQRLGVFMGAEFDWAVREPHDIWEDLRLSHLCRRAFSEPAAQLQMNPDAFEEKLRRWADDHRDAARAAGRRPGVKNPLLCVAIDFIRKAWGPLMPVVVERPATKVVASLNRLGWWNDEQERIESTAHLIAARDTALANTAAVRVDFEALRATPAATIQRLAEELGLDVTAAQLAAAVETIVRPDDARRGTANTDPQQHARDLLLAKVESDPNDAQSAFFLAQAYFFAGNFAAARDWYARRTQMGGWDEEVYFASYRLAESISQLDAPWPDVHDAYLRAWETRPNCAEPLFAIARRYREAQRYQPGYLYAKHAAEIPFPEQDLIIVDPEVYTWRATDEQAVCASWIGKHSEAFALWRRLLARPDLPDADRGRIAANRDVCVATMLDAASRYPNALVQSLSTSRRDRDVTISLLAGPDLASTVGTLNSFLNCCLDAARIGRFLVSAAGLSAQDRATLQERYGFLEFVPAQPGDGPSAQLAQIRTQIDGDFWLHLGSGWRFFAPEQLITRLTAVLHAEPQVFQVGINLADSPTLTGISAAEPTVRRAPDTGRYLLTTAPACGPAMFQLARLEQASGLCTASLDEVLCVGTV